MARIGPNAVTRLAEAAHAALGGDATAALFEAAGLGDYLAAPPDAMVEEDEVVAVYAALANAHPAASAAIATDAGARTARYLLANRIPQPVQWLLHALPAWAASRVLVMAIGRHAWTFAGTGAFAVAPGPRVTVRGGPFAAPGAADAPLRAFYAAVFDTLFKTLVSRRARVEDTDATPGVCRFTVRWCTRSLRAARAGGPIHG
jgi:divinyl protochlorophyllide a 8-vinyl-reductase